MKRRWFAVIGGFFLVVSASIGLFFGLDIRHWPAIAVGVLAWAVVGSLSIVGGLRESVGGVPWYRFVGASDVLLGLWMVGSAGTWYLDATAARATQVSAVAMAGGGLLLVFIGADYVLGGRHLDVSAFESGPIRGSDR